LRGVRKRRREIRDRSATSPAEPAHAFAEIRIEAPVDAGHVLAEAGAETEAPTERGAIDAALSGYWWENHRIRL
jgi:hypothetical protein